MKRIAAFVLITLVLAFSSLWSIGLADRHDLIYISKSNPELNRILIDPLMVPVQELSTCWLVKTEPKPISTHHSLNPYMYTLDANSLEQDYFLLYSPHLELDKSLLKRTGKLKFLEEDIWLFWGEDENPRSIFPRDIKIKRLPDQCYRPSSGMPQSFAPQPLSFHVQQQISEIIDEVDKNRLANYIHSLQEFKTRYASTPQCEEAGDYIFEFIQNLGLPTEYDSFSFAGHPSRNIIANLSGATDPGQIIIVCAHYDSTSNQKETSAPGADDNASGTSAVMEIARIMKNHPFDFTIKFILFSAEEWGLYGSQHYAQIARSNNDKIIGVINLDMIAYTYFNPESLDLIVNEDSAWLAYKFVQNAANCGLVNCQTVINQSFSWSDHSSFWDQRYNALCGIESDYRYNPHYHLTTDTIDYLNLDFNTDVTKAALATIADMAQPVSSPSTPTHLRCLTRIISSLFISLKMNQLTWNSANGILAGYNIYRSLNKKGDFQKLNTTLIIQNQFLDPILEFNQPYFYKVTAVGIDGQESNFSIEAADGQNQT